MYFVPFIGAIMGHLRFGLRAYYYDYDFAKSLNLSLTQSNSWNYFRF